MIMLVRRPAKLFKFACLSVSLFSLWVRAGIPVRAVGDANFDDALFVKLAASLGAGHWLGPFDNLTLVKGMFYPLFIVISFVLGIPLKSGEQIIYLLACYSIARMIIENSEKSYVLASAMFFALAMNPYLWTVALARVIREGIYVTETLLLVSMTTSLACHVCSGLEKRRMIVVLSFVTGLVAAAFFLTREESPWIVPALTAGVFTAAFRMIWSFRKSGLKAKPSIILLIRDSCIPIMVVSITFAVPVLAVETANFRHYGAFQTTEVQSYAFRRGYAALAGVEQDAWKRFIVFPKDARERAYSASPAARELAPTLDGPSGESWRRGGCEQDKRNEHDFCPEILSGWFQWALRDAVAAAGHYSSASEAGRYYERLADQLEAACRRGEIHCLGPRATLAPPFRWSYIGDTLRRIPAVASTLASFGSNLIGSLPSSGTDEQIAWFSDIVGQVEPPLSLPSEITGWVETTGELPALSVETTLTDISVTQPKLSSASDIVPTPLGLNVERFSFTNTGIRHDSRLVIARRDGEIVSLPITSLTSDTETREGDVTLHIDNGAQPIWTSPSRKREAFIEKIAEIIAFLYDKLSVPSIILAVLGMIVRIFRPVDRANNLLYALALASGVGVLSRVTLLSYLDVTSIPSNNILYLSPASPLLVIFVIGGCHEVIISMKYFAATRRGKKRRIACTTELS